MNFGKIPSNKCRYVPIAKVVEKILHTSTLTILQILGRDIRQNTIRSNLQQGQTEYVLL